MVNHAQHNFLIILTYAKYWQQHIIDAIREIFRVIISNDIHIFMLNKIKNLAKKAHIDLKYSLRIFATGFAMGSADLVPGVSGGTIAFLAGIYEELIEGIKTLSGKTIKLFLQRKFTLAWQSVPFSFFIPLALGLFSAIFILASLITYLLENQAEFVWAFFFGLVVASAFVVSKRIKKWTLKDLIIGLLSAIFAYWLVGLVPVETSSNPLMFFFAGFIAICAMILPGISGSFILVIMGKYEQILSAVTQKDFFTLILVILGAVAGLAVFSRVLSWAFAKHHDLLIAILTGFMIGSLRKIWPWKEVIETRINHKGLEVPLVEKNVLPSELSPEVLMIFLIGIIGFSLIIILEKIANQKK